MEKRQYITTLNTAFENRKKIECDRIEFSNKLTFFHNTSDKWITRIAQITTTYWIMVRHLATCILAACATAWIDTFLIEACLVQRTFRANCTFGTTGGRCTHIIHYARTDRMVVHIATNAVWAAWRWNAWIWYSYWIFHCDNERRVVCFFCLNSVSIWLEVADIHKTMAFRWIHHSWMQRYNSKYR